jgi:hypothetical protein
MMPKLIDFQRTYRPLTVGLRCAMERADVTRLEADITIQFEKPTDGDLIVTRLSRLHVYPFASQGLGASNRQIVDILTAVLTDGLPANHPASIGEPTISGNPPPCAFFPDGR